MGYHEKRDPATGRIYRTFVVETLEDHARDQKFTAYCDACQHSNAINLDYWIKKLGSGYMMDRFRKRLTCIRCGSKNVRLIGSHNGRPKR